MLIKEEILTMEVGIELDEKVLKEVMDFTMLMKAMLPPQVPAPILLYEVGGHSEKHEWEGWAEAPRVSTDIRAAWQVVEKMTNEGWYWYGYSVGGFLRLNASQFTKEIPKDLSKLSSKIDVGIVDGDFEMTEAICKAALLAKLELV